MKSLKIILIFVLFFLSINLIFSLSDEYLLDNCQALGDEQLLFCPLGESEFNVPIGMYSAGGGPGGGGGGGGIGCGADPNPNLCCQNLIPTNETGIFNSFWNSSSGVCEKIPIPEEIEVWWKNWMTWALIITALFLFFIIFWKRRRYRVLSKGNYYYFYNLNKARKKRREVDGRLEKLKNGEWVVIN